MMVPKSFTAFLFLGLDIGLLSALLRAAGTDGSWCGLFEEYSGNGLWWLDGSDDNLKQVDRLPYNFICATGSEVVINWSTGRFGSILQASFCVSRFNRGTMVSEWVLDVSTSFDAKQEMLNKISLSLFPLLTIGLVV